MNQAIKCIKNEFFDLQWKAILKDIAKFYIYFILFYALAIGLVWGYIRLSLEPFKIDMDDVVFSNDPLPEFTNFNSYSQSLALLSKMTSLYMFILVCFGVFFATPPKSFKHVAVVTSILLLINNTPFFYGSLLEWSQDVTFLCGSVALAWLSSMAWFRIKEDWQKIHR